MPLPIPFRPNALPMLLDTGSVLGPVADPASVLEGSKYLGRIFYLKKVNWSGFPDYISRSEADSYKRRGRAIVLNYEDRAANWCKGGYDIGRSRGDWSAQQLREIDCENAVVYMSVDFRPANAAELAACMDCLRGFQDSALGARGRAVYGFAEVVREARRLGLADYAWLCGDGRRMYVEHGNAPDVDLMGFVNIWQQNNEQPIFGGVVIDDNYIYTPRDFGQWLPGEWKNRSKTMANEPQEIAKQLFGAEGKGWAMLGRSAPAAAAGTPRDNYLVEAVAEIRDQLGGPDHNFGGWPQLGGLTVVDALSTVGWFFGIPGFDPTPAVRAKLGLRDEDRPTFGSRG